MPACSSLKIRHQPLCVRRPPCVPPPLPVFRSMGIPRCSSTNQLNNHCSQYIRITTKAVEIQYSTLSAVIQDVNTQCSTTGFNTSFLLLGFPLVLYFISAFLLISFFLYCRCQGSHVSLLLYMLLDQLGFNIVAFVVRMHTLLAHRFLFVSHLKKCWS